LKKYLADYAFLFSIAGAVVLLDQWTKFLVRTNLAFGEIWPQGHWIVFYARIVNWRNTGAAFGMFQNLGIVFAVLAIVVTGAILYYFPKIPKQDWAIRIALSLQLGGAVGNLISRLTQSHVTDGNFIERLSQGYVTDFISIDSFAVFNVADASISIGVAILALSLFQREKKQKTVESPPADDEASSTQEVTHSQLPEEVKGE
jgi:signal peptidase II